MIYREPIMKELNDKEIDDPEFNAYSFDVKYDKQQFKDPATMGLLMYRLAKERKRSNFLFQEISSKLDKLIGLMESQKPAASADALVSDTDQRIIDYVRERGKVCAEEIKDLFGYKGANAACMRLNALHTKGMLEKGRAGKKVFFWCNG
jgi:hypothetical protein